MPGTITTKLKGNYLMFRQNTLFLLDIFKFAIDNLKPAQYNKNRYVDRHFRGPSEL